MPALIGAHASEPAKECHQTALGKEQAASLFLLLEQRTVGAQRLHPKVNHGMPRTVPYTSSNFYPRYHGIKCDDTVKMVPFSTPFQHLIEMQYLNILSVNKYLKRFLTNVAQKHQ